MAAVMQMAFIVTVRFVNTRLMACHWNGDKPLYPKVIELTFDWDLFIEIH